MARHFTRLVLAAMAATVVTFALGSQPAAADELCVTVGVDRPVATVCVPIP